MHGNQDVSVGLSIPWCRPGSLASQVLVAAYPLGMTSEEWAKWTPSHPAKLEVWLNGVLCAFVAGYRLTV